jgi:hypothetical protein
LVVLDVDGCAACDTTDASGFYEVYVILGTRYDAAQLQVFSSDYPTYRTLVPVGRLSRLDVDLAAKETGLE